jgi:hypothetical protein
VNPKDERKNGKGLNLVRKIESESEQPGYEYKEMPDAMYSLEQAHKVSQKLFTEEDLWNDLEDDAEEAKSINLDLRKNAPMFDLDNSTLSNYETSEYRSTINVDWQ